MGGPSGPTLSFQLAAI
ncbi:DUF6053 domain-containing protein [Lysobacter yananisis]